MITDRPIKDGLADCVYASVIGLDTPGRYVGMSMEIELTHRQGRWELLVLALLLAARVSEAVAESTYMALRESGLLEWSRVLQENPADVTRTHEILASEYRALMDRRRKVTAIYTNAQHLMRMYDGDLHNVYLQCMDKQELSGREQRYSPEATESLVQALRQLQQIKTQAHWICRVMAEAGLWPHLPPETTAYYCRHVRCALHRLGLVRLDRTGAHTRQEAEKVVEELFAGDTTCLYRLGKFYCHTADPDVCMRRCQVGEVCNYRNLLTLCHDQEA